MTAPQQKNLAREMGLSQATVSRYVARGMPLDLEGARAWRDANIAPYVRSDAEAPLQPGALNLAQERALLVREQRLEVAYRNKRASGLYAPIEALAKTLAAASVGFAERLEHLPGIVRRKHPDLDAAVLDSITATLADARNSMVDAMGQLMTDAIMRDDFGLNGDDDELTTQE